MEMDFSFAIAKNRCRGSRIEGDKGLFEGKNPYISKNRRENHTSLYETALFKSTLTFNPCTKVENKT